MGPESAAKTPGYLYPLIRISILAARGEAELLPEAIAAARRAGASRQQILRALFRSDSDLTAFYEPEVKELVERLRAGQILFTP
ncbi:MAG: hypothetical protein N2Z22_06405 [Turneriella sp.]|nr:hypothetical protein [Turneriella sp.]